MRRAWPVPLLCALLLFAAGGDAAEVGDPFPAMAASYLVKLNGAILWAHDPGRPLPPASLAKMMTALLVLERGRLDGVATASEAASCETGTRLGLSPGDRMRVRDLLAATLLGSANDAARVLAEHVAGSEARFVRLMNAKARALGMRGTHFANATGHHHPELRSTAEDLALLAEAALRNEVFAGLAATVRMEVRTADGRRVFTLENKNEMVGRYPGAIGVKTGYTREAGACLVVLAERGEDRALLVMLNAPNRWWDAVAMLDNAFLAAQKMREARRP